MCPSPGAFEIDGPSRALRQAAGAAGQRVSTPPAFVLLRSLAPAAPCGARGHWVTGRFTLSVAYIQSAQESPAGIRKGQWRHLNPRAAMVSSAALCRAGPHRARRTHALFLPMRQPPSLTHRRGRTLVCGLGGVIPTDLGRQRQKQRRINRNTVPYDLSLMIALLPR
jgi:hypothetical protein